MLAIIAGRMQRWSEGIRIHVPAGNLDVNSFAQDGDSARVVVSYRNNDAYTLTHPIPILCAALNSQSDTVGSQLLELAIPAAGKITPGFEMTLHFTIPVTRWPVERVQCAIRGAA